MRARRAGPGLAAVVILSLGGTGCGAAQSLDPRGASSPSGVRGVALVDGGCPVIISGKPCPPHRLAAHIVVTTRGTEKQVASVDTGAGGRFEITLRPGSYDVHATSAAGGPLPVAQVYPVTVRAHAFATLRIQFDSGIR